MRLKAALPQTYIKQGEILALFIILSATINNYMWKYNSRKYKQTWTLDSEYHNQQHMHKNVLFLIE